MKLTILVCFAFLLFACQNKKEAIVEQIKSYKDSINSLSAKETEINLERHKIHEDYYSKMKMDFERKSSSEMAKENALNRKLEREENEKTKVFDSAHLKEKIDLQVKKILFKAKIDSLELELKKY